MTQEYNTTRAAINAILRGRVIARNYSTVKTLELFEKPNFYHENKEKRKMHSAFYLFDTYHKYIKSYLNRFKIELFFNFSTIE